MINPFAMHISIFSGNPFETETAFFGYCNGCTVVRLNVCINSMKLAIFKHLSAKSGNSFSGIALPMVAFVEEFLEYKKQTRKEFTDMKPIKMAVGDRVELKKPHPCKGNSFVIMRVGSDVRIKCETCGHDMTIDRIKLERSIKKITHTESEEA